MTIRHMPRDRVSCLLSEQGEDIRKFTQMVIHTRVATKRYLYVRTVNVQLAASLQCFVVALLLGVLCYQDHPRKREKWKSGLRLEMSPLNDGHTRVSFIISFDC